MTALAIPCHLYYAGMEPTDFGNAVLSLDRFRFWLSIAIGVSLIVGAVGTIVPLRIGIKAFQKMEF